MPALKIILLNLQLNLMINEGLINMGISTVQPAVTLSTTYKEGQTLRLCVEKTLKNYFAQLDGQNTTGLYELVLSEVEAPLFAAVMEHVKGNQSKASELLGLNRGTLRKKLKQYDLL